MRAQFLLPSLFCFTGLVWLSPPSAIAESSPATNPATGKNPTIATCPLSRYGGGI